MALVTSSPRGSGRTTPVPSPSKKRRIDPSPVKQTWQAALSQVSDRARPGDIESTGALEYARHIKLPFDLRDPNVEIKDNVLDTLLKIFPKTHNLSRGICHLFFEVEELPDCPLPLTIAGLPVAVRDSRGRGRRSMFPQHRHGNTAIRICGDLAPLDLDSLTTDNVRTLADMVTRALLAQVPNIPIREVMLSAERRFSVVVKDNFNLGGTTCQRFPGLTAKCLTMYLNERDLHRPRWTEWKAQRLVQPNANIGTVDQTAYDLLRPGVLLHSNILRDHGHPSTYQTTSGALVKNPSNHVFMTMATHGIGENEEAHQLQRSGGRRKVGKAVVEVSHTDITLVELEKDVRFVNELFDEPGRPQPPLERLLGEVPGDRLRMADLTYLNSPWTGVLDGQIEYLSWRIQDPSGHPTSSNLNYTMYHWFYGGQPAPAPTPEEPKPVKPGILPGGICGSAISDDEGRVIGFYHFQIEEGEWEGYSVCVSADEVVRAGYRLSTDAV